MLTGGRVWLGPIARTWGVTFAPGAGRPPLRGWASAIEPARSRDSMTGSPMVRIEIPPVQGPRHRAHGVDRHDRPSLATGRTSPGALPATRLAAPTTSAAVADAPGGGLLL